MSPTWTETTVVVARPLAETVASFLLDLGSPGLATDDNEHTVTLTAYFPPDARPHLTALRALCDDLALADPTLLPTAIASRVLQSEDWAHNWMEHFPPLTLGARLYVIPPWVTDVPAGRVPIVIDPGLAFGTGHHATTQGCLVLIDRLVSDRPPERALDVGTGSGILAIAMAKLGVESVVAVDVDPLACQAARENCARNGTGERVRVAAETEVDADDYELITGNLLSSILIELAPRLSRRLTPRGHLIASGILIVEADSVLTAFAAQGLVERDRVSEAEWVTLDLVRAG